MIRNDLDEHSVELIGLGRFKLLLDEARPMLIATEFIDCAEDILEESRCQN
jgi:hypothetical protein